MKLTERINADFMTAFKAKEMNKKNFLGVIKGEIQTQKGKGIEPTDENVLKILKKMEKSLNETGTDEAKTELSYIEPYMPKMMSKEEVERQLHIYMSTCNVDEMNIGAIMKYFNSEFKGQVDNKLVSELARKELA